MAELTCALIKPDAIATLRTGDIISLIELNGFKIARMQKMHLSSRQAEEFYNVHNGKPFFAELVAYTISGPIIAMVLEKNNAIREWRELMGTTDPLKAAPGTIRKMFGINIGSNAVHGSDSPETAKQEVKFFFPDF